MGVLGITLLLLTFGLEGGAYQLLAFTSILRRYIFHPRSAIRMTGG
jgi:hypothetical protein